MPGMYYSGLGCFMVLGCTQSVLISSFLILPFYAFFLTIDQGWLA